MKMKKVRRKPGQKRAPLPPPDPDHAVELAYLNKLEERARHLSNGKEWQAMDGDESTLHAAQGMRARKERGANFYGALALERDRLELARDTRSREKQAALAVELDQVPRDALTTEEIEWRHRLQNRQTVSMGHGRWWPSEIKKAQALVARAADVKKAREILGGDA